VLQAFLLQIMVKFKRPA